MFYQKFWHVIKKDMMALFSNFHKRGLDIYRLNFAILTLISKEEDASEMRKFSPIRILNYSFIFLLRLLPIG